MQRLRAGLILAKINYKNYKHLGTFFQPCNAFHDLSNSRKLRVLTMSLPFVLRFPRPQTGARTPISWKRGFRVKTFMSCGFSKGFRRVLEGSLADPFYARLANGYFVNGHFEFQCAKRGTIFRGLAGCLFLPEGSSLFPPFLSLSGGLQGTFHRFSKYPFAKYPFASF